MKLLRTYFFRFVQLLNRAGNRDDSAPYFAIILMPVFLILNFFFLSSLFYVYFEFKYDVKITACLIFIGLFFFFYFMFVYKNKFNEIAIEHENETTKDKMLGNILIIGYIILSIGLLELGFYLMMLKNKGLI